MSEVVIKIKSKNTGLYVLNTDGKMTSDINKALAFTTFINARIFLNTNDFIPESYTFVYYQSHDEVIQSTKPVKSTNDKINHPKHYNSYSFEVIDVIDEVVPNYPASYSGHIQNAIKYVFRAPFKGTLLEDLKKAVWYLEHAISIIERGK